MICKIPGCNRPHLAKGLCQLHYWRAKRGDKNPIPPVNQDRILHDTIIDGDIVKAPLYNIKHELIDYTILDKDIYYEKFLGVKFNKSNYGYARFGNDFVHYHIIGKPKDRWTFIDHINRDRLDNRKENLRFVTPEGNTHNSSFFGGGYGKSEMRGVCYVKGRKTSPWRVTIWLEKRCGGKRHTRYFKTLEEAREYREKFPL